MTMAERMRLHLWDSALSSCKPVQPASVGAEMRPSGAAMRFELYAVTVLTGSQLRRISRVRGALQAMYRICAPLPCTHARVCMRASLGRPCCMAPSCMAAMPMSKCIVAQKGAPPGSRSRCSAPAARPAPPARRARPISICNMAQRAHRRGAGLVAARLQRGQPRQPDEPGGQRQRQR